MTFDTVDYAKGKTPMTDYQTKLLLAALADTLDLSADINEARVRFHSITGSAFTSAENTDTVNYAKGETPMTDLQYQDMKALREENNALKAQVAFAQRQNLSSSETSMTDYQFNAYQEAIYQLVKAKVEADASPEEILKAIAILTKSK